jgi:nitrite reductase (cytochrome c-552)
MRRLNPVVLMIALSAAATLFALGGCAPEKAQPVKTVQIPDGEIDPEIWGKAYPTEYELWKKTEEPSPAGKSKYKRGFDADKITYDKLSEFPYMALLFNGWGFGVAYNEPRGHANMVRDQLEIDATRIKAGGVCLTCKTPYAPKLKRKWRPTTTRSPSRMSSPRSPKSIGPSGWPASTATTTRT